MNMRDKILLSARPVIDTLPTEAPLEQFQNETLRPILKFQHNLLIEVCRQQFIKRKSVFFQLRPQQQADYIQQLIQRDQQFKQLLLGMVYGLFTTEEYRFFAQHQAELRRRITQLLLQRLQSVPSDEW